MPMVLPLSWRLGPCRIFSHWEDRGYILSCILQVEGGMFSYRRLVQVIFGCDIPHQHQFIELLHSLLVGTLHHYAVMLWELSTPSWRSSFMVPLTLQTPCIRRSLFYWMNFATCREEKDEFGDSVLLWPIPGPHLPSSPFFSFSRSISSRHIQPMLFTMWHLHAVGLPIVAVQ